MAEVVGLVASIVAILKVSHTTVKTLSSLSKDIKSHSRRIDRLRRKVETCRRILKRLSDKLHADTPEADLSKAEVSQALHDDIEYALGGTSDVFRDLGEACDAANKRGRTPKIFRKAKYSLFEKTQIEALGVELSQCFVDINLIMTIHWQDSHAKTQQKVVNALANHIDLLKASKVPSISEALKDIMAQDVFDSPEARRSSVHRRRASKTDVNTQNIHKSMADEDLDVTLETGFETEMANDRTGNRSRSKSPDREERSTNTSSDSVWTRDTRRSRILTASASDVSLHTGNPRLAAGRTDKERRSNYFSTLVADKRNPTERAPSEVELKAKEGPTRWEFKQLGHFKGASWQVENLGTIAVSNEGVSGPPLGGFRLLDAFSKLDERATATIRRHLEVNDLDLFSVESNAARRFLTRQKGIYITTKPHIGREEREALQRTAKEEEDRKYIERVRRDMTKFGMTPQYFENMWKYEEKGKRHKAHRRESRTRDVVVKENPTFPKIHCDDIEMETLKHYDIAWKRAPESNGYIILLEELTTEETDVLFQHTKKVRKRRPKRHDCMQPEEWAAKLQGLESRNRSSFSISSRSPGAILPSNAGHQEASGNVEENQIVKSVDANDLKPGSLSSKIDYMDIETGETVKDSTKNGLIDSNHAFCRRRESYEFGAHTDTDIDSDPELEERVHLNIAAEDLMQRLAKRWSLPLAHNVEKEIEVGADGPLDQEDQSTVVV